MENLQNILSIIFLIGIVWMYFDKQDLKKYYKKESEENLHDYEKLYFEYDKLKQHSYQMSDFISELEEKLDKAEEIISQQKQKLTRKTKKK